MFREPLMRVLARTVIILRAFGAKPRPPSLEEEIATIDRALHRGEAQLVELLMKSNYRHGVDCCPSCTVPGFADLLDQIARTRQWREVLRSKRIGAGGKAAPAG